MLISILRKELNFMPFANETKLPDNMLVGYAYVPIQQANMRNLFDPEYGLKEGTIFPILDKPLGVYGRQINGDTIFQNGGMRE